MVKTVGRACSWDVLEWTDRSQEEQEPEVRAYGGPAGSSPRLRIGMNGWRLFKKRTQNHVIKLAVFPHYLLPVAVNFYLSMWHIADFGSFTWCIFLF